MNRAVFVRFSAIVTHMMNIVASFIEIYPLRDIVNGQTDNGKTDDTENTMPSIVGSGGIKTKTGKIVGKKCEEMIGE